MVGDIAAARCVKSRNFENVHSFHYKKIYILSQQGAFVKQRHRVLAILKDYNWICDHLKHRTKLFIEDSNF